MEREILNQYSKEILDAAITVHKEMGPGLLESVYQQCLWKELTLRDIKVHAMVPIPLVYKGYPLTKNTLLIYW